jgi:hypothetical protein
MVSAVMAITTIVVAVALGRLVYLRQSFITPPDRCCIFHAAVTSVLLQNTLVNYAFLDNRCFLWTTDLAGPVKCGAMSRS